MTFQWQPEAKQRLILSANRDEFLHRPAAELHPWQEQDGVYAGKDLSQGGTWLGIHKNGRFAALTNHRDMRSDKLKNPISRGKLVLDFLTSNISPLSYLQSLEPNSNLYEGYNLLVSDHQQLGYYSNKSGQPAQLLAPGSYGLSNALLDTPWPKVDLAKQQLSKWASSEQHDSESLSRLLTSLEMAEASALPDTGIGLEMERILSSQKIITPNYGTRCSTGLIIGRNQIDIAEVSWDKDGNESSFKQYCIEVG